MGGGERWQHRAVDFGIWRCREVASPEADLIKDGGEQCPTTHASETIGMHRNDDAALEPYLTGRGVIDLHRQRRAGLQESQRVASNNLRLFDRHG
jgi:hypothetical protein